MAHEFVAEYRDLLAQLKRNEKRDINVLSMLAEDNKQHAAAIVGAIEQHILVAPAPVKLPALYVLDSIVKNVREPYTSLFARGLPEVFGSVWDSTLPDRRASLSRLFGTWAGVFPHDALDRVKARMAGAPAPAQLPLGAVLLPQQHQLGAAAAVAVLQVPASSGYGTAAVALAPVVALPPGTYGVPAPGPGPQPVVSLSPAAPYGGAGHHAAAPMHVQPAPQYSAAPLPGALPPGGGGFVPPSPQHAAGWPHPLAAALDPWLRQRSPSPAAQGFPYQQQHHHLPHHQQPMQQQQQQQPGGAVSVQLSDLLSSLAQTGVLRAPPGGGWRPFDPHDPAATATDLTPAFLRETHEGVIAALAEASARTRGAFLDLAFLRKQRQRAGGPTSRGWYVTIDHWLTGTVAAKEAAQAFEGEEDEAPPDVPLPLEPEDPEQPCCAISGEAFDKVYDQEREGWYYKGAVRLSGDAAAAHGVPDGSLVKTSVLAEAAHGPGAGAGAGGPGSGGGGGGELDAAGLAAEIAAAAAGAGAAGGGNGGAGGSSGGAGGSGGGAGGSGDGAAAMAVDASGTAAQLEEKKGDGPKGAFAGVKREAGAEEAPTDAKRPRAQ